MTGITLFTALLASSLILCLSPVYGLIVYVAVLAWYPSYLTVPVGTIDFTVHRVAILVLLIKLLWEANLLKEFKLIWLDKLIIVYFLGQIVAGSISSASLMKFLENRAGAIFDMVLPYFVVRMIVTNRKQYLTLLKAILILSAPLAIVGLYECWTGHNPLGFFLKYHGWNTNLYFTGYRPVPRGGFFRATVTCSHSIMFGLFFAMLGPTCVGLAGNLSKNKLFFGIGIALMAIGVLSSMSSGPILAALAAFSFLVFHRFRKYWKATIVTVVLMCGAVEYISNRHFYNVLGNFTFNPRTAWYRTRLMEVAFLEGGMSDHWVTGFGYNVDPGWFAKIDGHRHTDIVNQYLLILCRFGLIGLVPFLAVNIEVIKKLVASYKAAILKADRWLIWCLSAGLFGIFCAFFSVALFDQSATVLYMLIGLAGAMPTIVTKLESQKFTNPGRSYLETCDV